MKRAKLEVLNRSILCYNGLGLELFVTGRILCSVGAARDVTTFAAVAVAPHDRDTVRYGTVLSTDYTVQ